MVRGQLRTKLNAGGDAGNSELFRFGAPDDYTRRWKFDVVSEAMKRILSFFCLLSLFARVATAADGPATAPDAGPMVFQCDPKELRNARDHWLAREPAAVEEVRDLLQRANAALTQGPYTIIHKTHPLPGVDPHEYVSIATYYWPNPGTPTGLPYIRRDGERNPETEEYDFRPFGEMSSGVGLLAMAYYFTGDERYATRATLLIRTWFLDPATRMNPDLQHAQLIKGVNDGRGTGIIETTRLLNVLDGIGMLQGSNSWTTADQAGMMKWIAAYSRWMHESENGLEEQAAANNHGSWYDVQSTAFYLFLGDGAAAREVAEAAKKHRIAMQIEPDGSQPLELARTNSFGYSSFNLSALTLLADLGERQHVDLWNYRTEDGRSLRSAIDWMVPYATGEKSWTHQQISQFSFGRILVALHRAELTFPDSGYEKVIERIRAKSPAEKQGDLMRLFSLED